MSSLLQFPAIRKQYAGLGNPRFVSDLLVAVQSSRDGLIAALGLQPTDFAIITGLNYITGTPNTYTTGVIYYNGDFYYVGASFAEGQSLLPTTVDTLSKTFSDSVARDIYTLYQAAPDAAGVTPIFAGNMNAYRIDNKTLLAKINAITADYITSTLLATALSNYVAKAGSTMTGALTLNADPTAALGAATKQYVDNNAIVLLAKGYTHIADVGSGLQHYDVALGTTLTTTAYKVFLTIVNNNANDARFTWYIDATNQTTTSFRIYMAEAASVSQDIYLDWIVIAR
jgi:hypothetical protein